MSLTLSKIPENKEKPKKPDFMKYIYCIMVLIIISIVVFFIDFNGVNTPILIIAGVIKYLFILPSIVLIILLFYYRAEKNAIESFNSDNEIYKKKVIHRGQKSIYLIATAYQTPIGINFFAEALTLKHSFISLQTSGALKGKMCTVLSPDLERFRVTRHKEQLLSIISSILERLFTQTDPEARMKDHVLKVNYKGPLNFNELIENIKEMIPSHFCHITKVINANYYRQDWISKWIDNEIGNEEYMLSIDIDLIFESNSSTTESVSAIILKKAKPSNNKYLGVIHRPSKMSNELDLHASLVDVLTWGKINKTDININLWTSNLDNNLLSDVLIYVMQKFESFSVSDLNNLDLKLGKNNIQISNMMILGGIETSRMNKLKSLLVFGDIDIESMIVNYQ